MQKHAPVDRKCAKHHWRCCKGYRRSKHEAHGSETGFDSDCKRLAKRARDDVTWKQGCGWACQSQLLRGCRTGACRFASLATADSPVNFMPLTRPDFCSPSITTIPCSCAGHICADLSASVHCETASSRQCPSAASASYAGVFATAALRCQDIVRERTCTSFYQAVSTPRTAGSQQCSQHQPPLGNGAVRQLWLSRHPVTGSAAADPERH